MFFKKTKKDKPQGKSEWIPVKAGFEKTRSEAIISQSLDRLMLNRVFITVISKEYQSGSTVLVGCNEHQLLIDRPPDWPETATGKHFQIVFKDTRFLWNHFNIQFESATSDTLYFEFPKTLFRLQRRTNYRVPAPIGSKVSFVFDASKKMDAVVLDLSVTGLFVSLSGREAIQKGTEITDISVTLCCPGEGNQKFRYTVGRARVVRSFYNENLRAHCLGLRLDIENKDKEDLLKFIRRQELSLLRKSLPR
ncbi:MAG: PilZ domain-containing protein [Proteobacteria bacterium]|nr:PilZ domain-containing protein [Pseudomonadota bacterium]MBU1708592.1 PilZ domain-containing protein [Pseudomonadota bacterium]